MAATRIRIAQGGGTGWRGPLFTKTYSVGKQQEIPSYTFRSGPRIINDEMEDFNGSIPVQDFYIPMVRTDSNTDTVATGGTSGVSKAQFTVPGPGVIKAIGFYSESAVTQNGTNFLTFTGTNYLGAGAGSTGILSTTAHVNTTDSNAAAINGGAALTANQEYALTVSATAANLRVAKGDVIEVVATASGTGAPTNAPFIHFQLQGVSRGPWLGRTIRTAGLPQNQILANTANGVWQGGLDATNEAQLVGLDWGDQLAIAKPDASTTGSGRVGSVQGPIFECYAKVSALAAAQRVVIGFANTFNSTLSSITRYAWFKLNASLAVTIEGTDGTNTTTAQAARDALILTAGTYYLFTVDMSDQTAVQFFVDENPVGTINLSSLATTDVLQPIVALQKDSGTGVPTLSVDLIGVKWFRYS